MGQVWEACSLRGGGESVLDSWKKLKFLEIHIFGVDLEMLNFFSFFIKILLKSKCGLWGTMGPRGDFLDIPWKCDS